MQQLSIAVIAVLALAGCKDKWEKAASEMEGYKDKMCACKDKACAEGVEKDMRDWEKSMKDKFGKDEKPPDKIIERIEKVDEEMRKCKKAARKGGGDDAMKKMTEYKDQMCACKDSACAQKVSDDMTKWAQEQAKNMDDAPDADDMKKMTAVSEEMAKCMSAAMTGGGSAAPAPGSGGSATP